MNGTAAFAILPGSAAIVNYATQVDASAQEHTIECSFGEGKELFVCYRNVH